MVRSKQVSANLDQLLSFEQQSKIALLVGVGAYPTGSGGLVSPLQYAAKDVSDLGVELEKQGYTVRTMINWARTGEPFTPRFRSVDDFVAAKALNFHSFQSASTSVPQTIQY
jgi:hypothetical protein